MITLYTLRMTGRLQVEVVQASEQELDGWSAADRFTVGFETATGGFLLSR
ncbi:hypothetical protein [Synechococcus sp. MW101C3]|nr:hypothetical protein [Synechococcus sp. MW101C3]